MLNKRSSRFNMPPGGGMPNPMSPPPMGPGQMPMGPGPMPGGQMPMGPGPMPMGPGQMPMGPMPGGQFHNEPGQMHHGQSSYYPGFQTERIYQEIRENRRRIDNLARRVGRIENYLQIRDSSEPSYSDDKYSF